MAIKQVSEEEWSTLLNTVKAHESILNTITESLRKLSLGDPTAINKHELEMILMTAELRRQGLDLLSKLNR